VESDVFLHHLGDCGTVAMENHH